MDNRVRKVINGYVHRDYERVTSLARDYARIALGKQQAALLARFESRENPEQFEERVLISQNRTQAPFGKISGFMRRVYRPDKLKYAFIDERQPNNVDDIVTYTKKYGDDGESLLGWTEQAALHYNALDPNSIAWNRHSIIDGKFNFEPVVFSSEEIKDFKVVKGVIDYAIMLRSDSFSYVEKTDVMTTKVIQYYYYFTKEGLTLAVEFIADVANKTDYYDQFATDGELTPVKEKDKMFIVKEYPNEYEGVAVSRVGYKLDDETKGRTYISYWHSSLELFKQLVNAGSEYDLLLKLHIFLQKIQYYDKCDHQEGSEVCKGGKMHPTGRVCNVCHGTGMQIAKSSQDVILLKMPDDETQGTILKPSDLVHYVDIPTKIVEIYKGIVDESPHLICEAVFGVDISQIPNNQNATATENRNAYDTAQDTLHEFTKSPVKLFKFITNDIAKTVGYEDLKGELVYPNEYDLESEYELLTKLKLAKDAAASPEVVERLNERIFIKQNRTESNAMLIYNEMRKFQPFGSLGKELRMLIIQNLPDSSLQKALALNFKEITDAIIAKESDTFKMAKYDGKKAIVDRYAKVYADAAVKANSIKTMDLLDLEEDAQ